MADDATSTTSAVRTPADYRDVADKLRTRVDIFGKTLAAIVTVGTTAVGLDRLGDLFPTNGHDEWAWTALVGIGVAAGAAVAVAVRLMLAAGPVVIESELDVRALDVEERHAVQTVFKGAAKRFGYRSLQGLELRER